MSEKEILSGKGWEPSESNSDNELRWSKSNPGLRAEIIQTDKEIRGIIEAVEDMADVRRKGEIVLKELATIDNAAEVLEDLMTVLQNKPPVTASELPHRRVSG